MSFFRKLLDFGARFLDSDGDGKIEIADMPGAMARIASMQAQGLALVQAATEALSVIKEVASEGKLTSAGASLSADDVQSAFEKSKAPYSGAAAIGKAGLGQSHG